MLRVSNQLIVSNYLSDLSRIQRAITRLLRQTSTGKAFERPRENPAGTAVSLDLHSAINYLNQYNRNIDDGLSRLTYMETAVSDVDTQLQRVRELTVYAANTYLTRADRGAIAEEMNQLLEHVITLSNSNFRGRYIFSGYETLTESFAINSNTEDGFTNSITYQGDFGLIGRNIGVNRDSQINFTGKEVFLEQTYELTGRQLSSEPLGFGGTFEINDELFVVTPGMTLAEVRDLLNTNSKIEVYAYIDPDFRLNLTSLNSTRPIKMQDISGSVLEDLGLLPMGAFNLAQTGPTLPLTDSRGAIHSNAAAPLAFPLTLTTANQDLVVALSGAANDGFSQTEVLKLDAITYNTSAELVAEIQRKADLAFGEEKLLVNDLGGGVIEIETFVQSGTVTVSDLQLGGTAPDGTVDTASTLLGFNAVASVQEVADTAGVDGNDRFTIDLGLSAYRVTGDEEPLDLPPIEINIDATVALTVADLVDEINEKILKNRYLSGLVEAVDQGGRVRLQTTKEDGSVTAGDLLLANAVLGPVVPATDTLGALGFYVDPLTGISAPPVPATVFGTAPFPPGIGAIVTGVNDQFTIDLGPASSPDGTDQGPVALTLNPGAYPTAAALAAEINYQISLSPKLKNAVLAQVRVVGPLSFVDLVTTNVGSRVQANDLILADALATPGTLANLGLAGPTVPGGGSADGQGIIVEPHNLIDTVLQIRDELFGYAAPASRLVDLTDGADGSLGLFPGHTIRITSDGSFSEFTVQRFTTLDDLADAIEQKLGFALEVDVLRDGRLYVFNPTTTVVNDISIEAFDENGAPVAAFDQAFAPVSGKLFYRSELLSETMYEDERFQRLTNRIGDVDDAFETILSVLAQTGSRHKRLELTLTQNDAVEVNLIELQSKNDNVDIAETVIHLQEQENVLRAALGAGASVLPPSLFDFLF